MQLAAATPRQVAATVTVGDGSSYSSDNVFDSNPMVWHLYNSATSPQITTFIQQQEYRCQDKLNQMNDVLANMNKEIK